MIVYDPDVPSDVLATVAEGVEVRPAVGEATDVGIRGEAAGILPIYPLTERDISDPLSQAMALNRLIDARIDARNPRTAGRELPRGALRPWQVVLFSLGSLAVFLVAVYQLEPIVRWLWPIPVLGFVAYPYLKRLTWLSHAWLGAVDGLAPVGAWAAITNQLPWEAWLLIALG
mgnify:CR=1 FL=1